MLTDYNSAKWIANTRADLTEVINSDLAQEGVSGFWLGLRAFPYFYIPALTSLLADDDEQIRISTAFFLHALLRRLSLADVEEHREACIATLRAALQSDSASCLWTLRLFSQGPIPAELIDDVRLRTRLKANDHVICAAVALGRNGYRTEQIIDLMGIAMGHSLDDIGRASASALVQLAIVAPDAVTTIVGGINAVDEPQRRLRAVIAVGALGARGAVALPILSRILADHRQSPELRRHAAISIGRIADADSGNAAELDRALSDDNWQVFEGAAMGLAGLRHFPLDGPYRLGRHLSHPLEEHRCAALRGIKCFGAHAASLVPALIERLEVELSDDELICLSDALGGCGPAAVTPLLQALDFRHGNSMLVFSGALQVFESDALRVLGEALVEEHEPWRFGAILGGIGNLGPAAEPLLPVLGTLLARETDEHLADAILTTLVRVGHVPSDVGPGLIRCLLLGNEKLADRAGRLLQEMGPGIAPDLATIMDFATPEQQTRLNRVLAAWPERDLEWHAKLEAFDDDAKLERVLRVLDCLNGHGSLSYPEIAQILADLKAAGKLPRGCATGDSSLRTAVRDLEKALYLPIVDNKPGGAGGLTEDGSMMAGTIRRYFAAKVRRVL